MASESVSRAGPSSASVPTGSRVHWVECPRDAWQGLPTRIPTAAKREYLRELLAAGFRHLDLGSFVSPRAVPQMADTEAVLAELERPDGADFLCIVANMQGLERAQASDAVTSVGYPLSLSETFQHRNTGMDTARSWELVEELAAAARRSSIEPVVYLSMGFGNPFGDPWRPSDTAEAVTRLRDRGIERLALADTVGTADASLVRAVLAECDRPFDLGVHLHARPDRWRPVVEAAWEGGVRWFEGALAGVGGCPFAGDELVGNLPSERVLPWLAEVANTAPVSLDALPGLATSAAALADSGRGAAGHA
ncbi:MAG: hydroxymethylglutaryl-CoA lyase [Trueperaceae bacterium]